MPWRDALEQRLEAERDQLPLWLPVMLGGGGALWFVLPDARSWTVAALALAAAGLAALASGRGGRASRALAVAALATAAGLLGLWWRAERVAAPVLARPVVARFTATVERVEPLAARELVRLTLAPRGVGEDGRGREIALPRRVRVNLVEADAPAGLYPGGMVRLRARLMPPPGAAVPGAYDYARAAWFAGVGATGRGFAPVKTEGAGRGGGPGLRARLSTHITAAVPGSAGGVAAALATGDVGAIDEADAEAMRAAGLAHLLSVSGLHITAVVGATVVLVMRLLALSPALALRVRLPLVAGAAGAVAAIGYTLLTGAEVPTIRSCVAALLVLAALALGREAMTLRLVAAGALVVLLIRPEALAGASFQLSFAAITAIVALHEHPRVRGWSLTPLTGWRRGVRGTAMLLLTGVVVEAALMPIAVYHFHKAGVYGAVANIAAIPWTTFVVMPLELVALLLDGVGLGAPAWWLTDGAIGVLLRLARWTAARPGAVQAWPAMPDGAFALVVAGGLWIALWRTEWRRWGIVPVVAGLGWAAATPAPDLLVTGDGRHAAVRLDGGAVALLRDRTGDYMRDVMAANGGVAEPVLLGEATAARCTADLCLARVRGRRVLMTRSAYLVPAAKLITACRAADVVVSERRLPRGCTPRWLRLDRETLARTGGVAVTFGSGRVTTVRRPGDRHPWVTAAPR